MGTDRTRKRTRKGFGRLGRNLGREGRGGDWDEIWGGRERRGGLSQARGRRWGWRTRGPRGGWRARELRAGPVFINLNF